MDTPTILRRGGGVMGGAIVGGCFTSIEDSLLDEMEMWCFFEMNLK